MVDSSGRPVGGDQLLETKLYVPRRRAAPLARPRLLQRLDAGAARKLTLVSAPPGYGKTTLIAEWVAAMGGRQTAAWVSLDQSDNDETRFWSYVITALRGRTEVGEVALRLLQSPQPPPIQWVLTHLINELGAIEGELSLVLDDFHVIDAEPIHGAMAFLLENLPPQMHLVIASRSDPPLPLPRLRARDELTELRAPDLSFNPEEAAAFLNESMRLGLSPADVAALEERTEGWIVGLQLAAVSIEGRKDASGFIQAFAGDERHVIDYLVEEVLQRQPPRVRDFLLQTSILDRLSGPLCDAVTGQDDGTRQLEELERKNLFIVPLDDRRHWYRYHHLFADVLQSLARREEGERLSVLHGRASDWYENNGLRADAVRHALASGDVNRAAALLELVGRAMLTRGGTEFIGWLRSLPASVFDNRPVLLVYRALSSLPDDLEAARIQLQAAERLLEPTKPAGRSGGSSTEIVVADHESFRSLPGTIAIVHAYLAGAAGDVPGTGRHARRALDLLPEQDHLWRGAAGALLGLAMWTAGQLEEAYEAFATGLSSLRKTGDISYEINGNFNLANIRTAQGRLREAALLYEAPLEREAARGGPQDPRAADMYVGLSEVRLEQGDLEAAQWCLRQSEDLGESGWLPENRYRAYVARARFEEALGKPDRAIELLDEAERAYVRSPDPYVRPIPALRARVWIRQGRLTEAAHWVSKQGLSIADELSYLREFEHLTFARLLIARYRAGYADGAIRDAVALLERLGKGAGEAGRAGSLIEVLILQAVALQAEGHLSRAVPQLERALELAEPDGYVRVFLDEGDPMRALLRRVVSRGAARTYARHLLSAFDGSEKGFAVSTAPSGSGLVEPLTGRELEILRLVASGMRNQEIAERLFISLATVKRHIANAYGKLGASHRTAAVARAQELDLL